MDKSEFKKNISLYTAMGLIKGSVYVVENLENAKDINRDGLVRNLKQVQQILEEFLNDK